MQPITKKIKRPVELSLNSAAEPALKPLIPELEEEVITMIKFQCWHKAVAKAMAVGFTEKAGGK